MLHEGTPDWQNRWRTVGLISMVLCLGVLFLWQEQPGQLCTFRSDGTEYSLRADFGRLLLIKWSGQDGLRILWNIQLWPLIFLTGVPPLFLLWKLGPYRAKQPRGFPVEEQKRSE